VGIVQHLRVSYSIALCDTKPDTVQISTRRDYDFYYNRETLEAVRKDQIKLNLKPRNPEFHFYEVFNVYHDPANSAFGLKDL
jgi:hypothetical protein